MLPVVRSARSPMLSVVPVILLTKTVSQSVQLRWRSWKSGQESGVPRGSSREVPPMATSRS